MPVALDVGTEVRRQTRVSWRRPLTWLELDLGCAFEAMEKKVEQWEQTYQHIQRRSL